MHLQPEAETCKRDEDVPRKSSRGESVKAGGRLQQLVSLVCCRVKVATHDTYTATGFGVCLHVSNKAQRMRPVCHDLLHNSVFALFLCKPCVLCICVHAEALPGTVADTAARTDPPRQVQEVAPCHEDLAGIMNGRHTVREGIICMVFQFVPICHRRGSRCARMMAAYLCTWGTLDWTTNHLPNVQNADWWW